MEGGKVLGIGGVFFRARDPDGLTAWYRDMLGVGPGCGAEEDGEPSEWYWLAEGGETVFAPFRQDSDYFPADKAYMLNFRVGGIGALIARLRDLGVEVIEKEEWNDPATGRFARIHDPEGNPIELWQPPAD